MKTTKTLGFALLAGLALSIPVANAQVAGIGDAIEGVNMFGLGVAGAPDYMGSNHNKAYPAVVARYQFEGTERFITLVGPQVQLNLLNDSTWRFGPQLTYRGKRDGDVDNATVKQMTPVDSAVEGGVFLTYRLKLSNQMMHQINFTGDIAGGSNGTIGGLRMMWWQPLSQQWLLSLGAGVQYANSKWMNTYFGVTTARDIALYPSLGGQPYNAGSGVKGFNIPFGISYLLDKQWILSAGARYEKLAGDAKDSPVTSISGNSNQWVYGATATYRF